MYTLPRRKIQGVCGTLGAEDRRIQGMGLHLIPSEVIKRGELPLPVILILFIFVLLTPNPYDLKVLHAGIISDSRRKHRGNGNKNIDKRIIR